MKKMLSSKMTLKIKGVPEKHFLVKKICLNDKNPQKIILAKSVKIIKNDYFLKKLSTIQCCIFKSPTVKGLLHNIFLRIF